MLHTTDTTDFFDERSPFALHNPADEHFMQQALLEAEKARELQEVPIGVVIVHQNRIIGRGHNLTERLQDPTAHAEMIAITAAAASLESRRLLECTMYVTLEPCAMCSGAIVLARIPRLVYAAADPKAGASGTLYSITNDPRLNHRCQITQGVLEGESAAMLREFFAGVRKAGRSPWKQVKKSESEPNFAEESQSEPKPTEHQFDEE
jgi:tRNA(adenine34) deaminase